MNATTNTAESFLAKLTEATKSTPQAYGEAIRTLIHREGIEVASNFNRNALMRNAITMKFYQAACTVLTEEFLNR